jgi:hypothetical protein
LFSTVEPLPEVILIQGVRNLLNLFHSLETWYREVIHDEREEEDLRCAGCPSTKIDFFLPRNLWQKALYVRFSGTVFA